MYETTDPEARAGLQKKKYKHLDAHGWSVDLPANVAFTKAWKPEIHGVDWSRHPDDTWYFDAVPVAVDQILCFSLVSSTMTVWHGRSKESQIPPGGFPDCTKKNEDIPAGFQEQFVTYVYGERYYFITSQGKVYVSNPPRVQMQRKIERVLIDGDRLVSGLVTDVDRGITYAFIPPLPARADKGAYFLLTEPGKLTLFDEALVKQYGAGSDLSVRKALGYARILHADGKIGMKESLPK
jgi:hypothetical protein